MPTSEPNWTENGDGEWVAEWRGYYLQATDMSFVCNTSAWTVSRKCPATNGWTGGIELAKRDCLNAAKAHAWDEEHGDE